MNQVADSLKRNLRYRTAGILDLVSKWAFRVTPCAATAHLWGWFTPFLGSCALAFEPLALHPGKQANDGALQDGDVLRDQHQAERQHPESQHWQKAEDTAEDQ